MGLLLASSLLTVCSQLGHSFFVLVSEFNSCVCGPGLRLLIVCFQLSHSFLVFWPNVAVLLCLDILGVGLWLG